MTVQLLGGWFRLVNERVDGWMGDRIAGLMSEFISINQACTVRYCIGVLWPLQSVFVSFSMSSESQVLLSSFITSTVFYMYNWITFELVFASVLSWSTPPPPPPKKKKKSLLKAYESIITRRRILNKLETWASHSWMFFCCCKKHTCLQ